MLVAKCPVCSLQTSSATVKLLHNSVLYCSPKELSLTKLRSTDINQKSIGWRSDDPRLLGFSMCDLHPLLEKVIMVTVLYYRVIEPIRLEFKKSFAMRRCDLPEI